MSKKPRILIIENSRQVTGALKSIVAMASELSSEFEFIFVMPTGQPALQWVKDRGYETHGVAMRELSKKLTSVVFYFPSLAMSSWKVRSLIRSERISIVHSNDLYNMIGPMLRVWGQRVPYVCHVRFLRQAFPGWLFDFWAKRQLQVAHRVIAVSEVLKQQLPSSEQVVKIHDRVMATEKHPTRQRSGASTRTLLYLSNIIPGKGQDYAIEAFRQVAGEFPEWQLRFVGSDMGLEKNKNYRDRLQELARVYELQSRIEWLDFTNDVELEYKNADIALNFSDLESFSMTCLEAQFFGCPVIATRSGGPNEIIEDGRTGLLVATGNVPSMVEALRKLMSNESKREMMGSNGADQSRRRFGASQTTDLLRAVYRELLALPPHR